MDEWVWLFLDLLHWHNPWPLCLCFYQAVPWPFPTQALAGPPLCSPSSTSTFSVKPATSSSRWKRGIAKCKLLQRQCPCPQCTVVNESIRFQQAKGDRDENRLRGPSQLLFPISGAEISLPSLTRSGQKVLPEPWRGSCPRLERVEEAGQTSWSYWRLSWGPKQEYPLPDEECEIRVEDKQVWESNIYFECFLIILDAYTLTTR